MKKSYNIFALVLLSYLILNCTLKINNCECQWVQSSSGLMVNGYVNALTNNNGILFAGTNGGGIYKSTNNGVNWIFASSGLQVNNNLSNDNYYLNALYSYSNYIFAGTNNGIFRSSSYGNSWAAGNIEFGYSVYVFSFLYHNDLIYAGTTMGLYKSSDYGINWNLDFYSPSLRYLASYNNYLFGGSFYSGMYRSSNNGANWTAINSGLPSASSKNVRALAVFSGELYISLDTSYNNSMGVYKSTNFGDNWIQVNNGLLDKRVRSFTYSGNNIFAGTYIGVYVSTNNGSLWSPVTNGLTSRVSALMSVGSNIYAGSMGMYSSSNNGNQWNQINAGLNLFYVNDICGTGNTVYCNSDFPFKTTNNGGNWILFDNGINTKIKCIYSVGDEIFAGSSYGGGVFKSTNNGMNWFQSNTGLPDSSNINAFYYYNGYLFTAVDSLFYDPKGVYRSSNHGASWEKTSLYNFQFTSFSSFGSKLFAGSSSNGLFVSTNNGNNWNISLNVYVSSIAVCNNLIFVGTTSSGILWSPDGGFSWTPLVPGPSDPNINTLYSHGSNLLAGTKAGIFVSTNSGTNWISKNDGLYFFDISKIFVNNDYIFSVTNGNGIYKRPKSEVISVQNISEIIPSEYKLFQNYPNPFNPVTKIRFEVPLSKGGLKGVVSLKVYDLLGREVATLVNEKLNPGTYEVSWNASQYTSGVYFYSLITDGYSETEKMILLK